MAPASKGALLNIHYYYYYYHLVFSQSAYVMLKECVLTRETKLNVIFNCLALQLNRSINVAIVFKVNFFGSEKGAPRSTLTFTPDIVPTS